MEDIEKKAKLVSDEVGISKNIAMVALHHARGSIKYAKELLSNQTCVQIFWKEAREFDI